MRSNQHKTETLNARVEPALKNNAERILKKLGLSNAEAIRLFYTQICLNNGLPFRVNIPNNIEPTTGLYQFSHIYIYEKIIFLF